MVCHTAIPPPCRMTIQLHRKLKPTRLGWMLMNTILKLEMSRKTKQRVMKEY